jgi:hypothetical protein
MSPGRPRVTVGMIVLDGMPFVPYTLRALYPHAAQIVVVEGAAPGARGIARPDGHSRDGTLEELRRFAAEEDPEGKLTIVTAEDEGHPDGFWPGEKVEQSRAYATRATGDYLWQVDVDEFYLPADLARVHELLAADPGITAVTFPTVTIWGGLGVATDGWYLQRGGRDFHRLFKWGDGYTYAAHRPPTVLDGEGRDLRTLRWLDGRATGRLGIMMRHYSLLFPKQVREKVEYYANWGLYRDLVDPDRLRAWMEESYQTLRKPYRVHNVYRMPSWLERYPGEHPPEVRRMMADIAAGRLAVETRPLDDVERLLSSSSYAARREALRLAGPVDDWARRTRWSLGPRVRRLLSAGRA